MPCFNLGKYGEHWLPIYTDLPNGDMDFGYLNNLIEDGRQCGKTPWAACSWHQLAAFEILNKEGDYPQATREEAINRRNKT